MSDLTKVSVNLTPKSRDALRQAIAISEDTQTDTINRALQLYALVVKEMAEGGEMFFRKPRGVIVRVRLDL